DRGLSICHLVLRPIKRTSWPATSVWRASWDMRHLSRKLYMVTVEEITRVSDRLRCNAEGARMPVLLRRATEADAKRVESLLAERGYPSKEADVRHRLRNSLRSDTSCFLLAQSASEVVGLVCAELVPYFPRGSTICRVTGLVVSAQHRGRGVGETLLAGAAD